MILHKILPQRIIKLTDYPCIFDRIKTYLDKSAGSLAEWLPWANPWDRGTARDTELKQSGMRGQWEAELLSSVPMQPEMGIWQAGHIGQDQFWWKQGARSGDLPSFACPHMLRYRHPQSRQWLKASVPPPIFPINGKTAPKEDIMARVAAKHDGTAPRICNTPFPSLGNSRSKSQVLCGSPLSSVPFLRGSSFTSKWQNSSLTVGQGLFPRWNQGVWVWPPLY